jgi:hypothetical protein
LPDLINVRNSHIAVGKLFDNLPALRCLLQSVHLEWLCTRIFLLSNADDAAECRNSLELIIAKHRNGPTGFGEDFFRLRAQRCPRLDGDALTASGFSALARGILDHPVVGARKPSRQSCACMGKRAVSFLRIVPAARGQTRAEVRQLVQFPLARRMLAC